MGRRTVVQQAPHAGIVRHLVAGRTRVLKERLQTWRQLPRADHGQWQSLALPQVGPLLVRRNIRCVGDAVPEGHGPREPEHHVETQGEDVIHACGVVPRAVPSGGSLAFMFVPQVTQRDAAPIVDEVGNVLPRTAVSHHDVGALHAVVFEPRRFVKHGKALQQLVAQHEDGLQAQAPALRGVDAVDVATQPGQHQVEVPVKSGFERVLSAIRYRESDGALPHPLLQLLVDHPLLLSRGSVVKRKLLDDHGLVSVGAHKHVARVPLFRQQLLHYQLWPVRRLHGAFAGRVR